MIPPGLLRLIARLSVAGALIVALLAFAAAACGGDGPTEIGVTIEPLTSTPATAPSPRAGIAIGGKGAAPAATPIPDNTATSTNTVPPRSTDAEPLATATGASEPKGTRTTVGSLRPTSGRWIEVDVTNYVVRLMDGETVVREITPVGVGVAIDTGEYISTQTGLFEVHNKVEELVYDAPFDTYISHWVGFDPDKDNGFHSFLKDADGNVVDASTGRVSNGCIRTGEPDVIFAYAEIGMPVWVHW